MTPTPEAYGRFFNPNPKGIRWGKVFFVGVMIALFFLTVFLLGGFEEGIIWE